MSLHHHVRLLSIRRKADHIQQTVLGKEPVRAVVIVEMLSGAECLAGIPVQTSTQLLLRSWVEIAVSS